jgi:hypothetical protein
MEPDLKELHEEIKRLGAVCTDTNRIVHGMRSAQRWNSFISLLRWGVIIALMVASYVYIQPYIQQATAAYSSAQDLQLQVQNFFAKFGGAKSQ